MDSDLSAGMAMWSCTSGADCVGQLRAKAGLDRPQPGRTRDPEIDRAKRSVRKFIEENPQRIFYIKQVQVLLEKWHYHWITGFAIAELIAEGVVAVEDVGVPFSHGKVRFIFHPQHRRRKRQIKRAISVIDRYSTPEISQGCGSQAEVLFLVALMEYKFELFGRNTREHRGRRWDQTKQNLDFVVGRDGVEYGVEVKNTWDYIPPDELEAKLGICAFLGLRPLFIMRYAAKSYIHQIDKQGGYGMLFVAHVFPKGQEQLVEDIRTEFWMPCDAPTRIPDGILLRFVKWHCGVAGVNYPEIDGG